jgi:hypothetical protein
MKNIEAHQNLGVLYQLTGKMEKAEKHILTAIDFDSEYWLSHYNLGMCQYLNNKLIEAMNCFNKALKFNSNIKSKIMYATCLLEDGKTHIEYENAKKILSNVLEHDYENVDGYIRYIQACIKLNNIDEATHSLNLVSKSSSFDDSVLHKCMIAVCKIEIGKMENNSNEVWRECQNIISIILGTLELEDIETGFADTNNYLTSIIGYKKYFYTALREMLPIARRKDVLKYDYYSQLMTKTKLAIRSYYEQDDDCWIRICDREIQDDIKFLEIVERDFVNNQEMEYEGTASAQRDEYLTKRWNEECARKILENSIVAENKIISEDVIISIKNAAPFLCNEKDLVKYIFDSERKNFIVYMDKHTTRIELWYVNKIREQLKEARFDKNKCVAIIVINKEVKEPYKDFLVWSFRKIKDSKNSSLCNLELSNISEIFKPSGRENYSISQKFKYAFKDLNGKIGILENERNKTAGRESYSYSELLFKGGLMTGIEFFVHTNDIYLDEWHQEG